MDASRTGDRCDDRGDGHRAVMQCDTGSCQFYAGVENRRVHARVALSVAQVLRFGAQCFERSATRLLFPLVCDHCCHRNAMMGADHAAGQNTLLHQVQEIGTRHLEEIGGVLCPAGTHGLVVDLGTLRHICNLDHLLSGGGRGTGVRARDSWTAHDQCPMRRDDRSSIAAGNEDCPVPRALSRPRRRLPTSL